MRDFVYPPVVVAIKTLWKYLGLRFSFSGVENIPAKGGAILAINHIGYLDFAIAGTAVLPRKRYVRFMAKKEIFDNKVAGPLMRGMHHICVDRSSGSSSFVAALRYLRAGEIVGIFPEATISRSFEIKELKTGAVRLAMGSNTPIIPTIVWGSQRIFTKKVKPNWKRNKFPITVAFGEPLIVQKGQDVDEAESQLRRLMKDLLSQVQSEYPDSPKGQRWAPARLGGTAPTPEQVEIEWAEHLKEKARNEESN
jgi:1-acyl-sn-glycerol-3-phosphate acyltransferase